MGVFGLAVPARWSESAVSTRCFALVTAELARGWMSLAGAMGGHSVVARLLARLGTAEQQERVAAADGHRRGAGRHGAHRAQRRLRPAGHPHARRPGRRRLRRRRQQDLDHQRPARRADRHPGQDRSGGRPPAPRDQHPARRARPGGRLPDLPSSATAGSRRRAVSPVAGAGACSAARRRRLAQFGRSGSPAQVAARAVGVAARSTTRRAARDLRPADLAAPVGRQPARRHGDQVRAARLLTRGRRHRRRPAQRPRGRHGQALRVGGVHAGRARRHAHPRGRRLLGRARRRALLPRRAADDRRRGHQRDPARRHRPPAGRTVPRELSLPDGGGVPLRV